MVICLCRRVNDKQIQRMLSNGKNLWRIQEETGAGRCCSKCLEQLRILCKGTNICQKPQGNNAPY